MCYQDATQLEELSEAIGTYIDAASGWLDRIKVLAGLFPHLDGQSDGLKGCVALMEVIFETATKAEEELDVLLQAQNRTMAATERGVR
jgi:hypothetical protein